MRTRSILSRFIIDLLPGGRPPVAIEISPTGVLAGYRSANGGDPSCAFQALPPGIIVPGIDAPNLRPPETVSTAIRSALEQVSPHSRDITLILPDSTTRVFILDFESLPDDTAEILEILRFRLRKVVHFDVQHAKISYQILPSNQAQCRALVVIIPESILTEYEGAVRAAGYQAGSVLPSGVAGLAAMTSSEPMLLAFVAETSVITSITQSNDILLYRTHELSADPALRPAELRHDIAVAAAYFEDHLRIPPKCLYYTGPETLQELARSLDLHGLAVLNLVPQPQGAGPPFPEYLALRESLVLWLERDRPWRSMSIWRRASSSIYGRL